MFTGSSNKPIIGKHYGPNEPFQTCPKRMNMPASSLYDGS